MTKPTLRARAATLMSSLVRLPALALVIAPLIAGTANAAVELRVEARPIEDPILVFVKVTDSSDNLVTNLLSDAFTVTVGPDGQPFTIQTDHFTRPPAEDPNQHVSVVFAMDYSKSVTNKALGTLKQAVIDFVEAMEDGDQAAVIKFNATLGASIVQPFTTIDHGTGNAALETAVGEAYEGNGTNLLDALELAVSQFEVPSSLPAGPKAIILFSDGGENESTASESEVVAHANANNTAIFTIGVGDLTLPGRVDLLSGLSGETGGQYFPTTESDPVAIAAAYASVSLLLSNEYLISIPSDIDDCDEHVLEVDVAGQAAPASVLFTRRTCNTEPNAFSFNAKTNVARGTTVTSNTVTISGIEVPAHISVIGGRYSIGCDGAFTGSPGTISNGETVCVRQNVSDLPSTTVVTTLTIGGIAGTFSTTTRAGGGGGGGGGGGTTGPVELLIGLVALLARRRRRA